MIKIDIKDIEMYTTKCHTCGAELIIDANDIKKCSDEKCLFRLFKNRIPYKAKKIKKGAGKCCGG